MRRFCQRADVDWNQIWRFDSARRQWLKQGPEEGIVFPLPTSNFILTRIVQMHKFPVPVHGICLFSAQNRLFAPPVLPFRTFLKGFTVVSFVKNFT